MKTKKPIHILLAEDDDDDKLLITKAFEKCLPTGHLICVNDGEALTKYLHQTSGNDQSSFLTPDLILLDLNMPRKDGKAALQEIKSHEDFKKIPVIIFTTSSLQEDIDLTYKMGSNSFITKPSTFDELARVLQELTNYWSSTVELPT